MRTHRGGGEESALCRQVTTRCVLQRVGQEAVRGELGVDQPLGSRGGGRDEGEQQQPEQGVRLESRRTESNRKIWSNSQFQSLQDLIIFPRRSARSTLHFSPKNLQKKSKETLEKSLM